LVVKGLHYTGIAASKNMERAFAQTVEDSVAASAGDGISQNDICVQLDPGSIIVKSTIALPNGVSASMVESRLASTKIKERISESVAAGVATIPGIDAVKTGTIGVSHVTILKPEPAGLNMYVLLIIVCCVLPLLYSALKFYRKKESRRQVYALISACPNCTPEGDSHTKPWLGPFANGAVGTERRPEVARLLSLTDS